MVFQGQLLFPHLSALDNVAFGPRSRGRSRREADQYIQGGWVTVDGEVVSESGTCDEATTTSSVPTPAQEEGL